MGHSLWLLGYVPQCAPAWLRHWYYAEFQIFERVDQHVDTTGAVVRRHAINLRAYVSVPYHAAWMLNQLRRDHRAWPMFELKSGAAMAAPAAPMPPPLVSVYEFAHCVWASPLMEQHFGNTIKIRNEIMFQFLPRAATYRLRVYILKLVIIFWRTFASNFSNQLLLSPAHQPWQRLHRHLKWAWTSLVEGGAHTGKD